MFTIFVYRNVTFRLLSSRQVTALFKSGKNSDLSNYRPVILSVILSKLSGKHINKHVPSYFKKTAYLTLTKRFFFCTFLPGNMVRSCHVQSIIDYGSTLWDSASPNTLQLLVSLRKTTLKAILLKTTTLAN